MNTLTVSLSEANSSFVEETAAAEGFASAGAYVDALVRQARIKKAKMALDAKLLEAMESGPATEMTREDWDQLERQVWEEHRRDQERAAS